MKTLVISILSLVVSVQIFLAPAAVSAQSEERTACADCQAQSIPSDGEKKDSGHSVLHTMLWYLPNRLLDVLDIFRMRVRVGPGLGVGVRATKVVQVYAGTYASVYAGLPGPRLREFPKSPVGLESYNGVAVSVVEAATGGGIGPDYSPTEFGFDFQLGIIGLAFGVDPVEIADFGAGIFTFDPREDDI